MKIYQKIYKNIINTASFKEPDEYHLALLPIKQFYKKPELIHSCGDFSSPFVTVLNYLKTTTCSMF